MYFGSRTIASEENCLPTRKLTLNFFGRVFFEHTLLKDIFKFNSLSRVADWKHLRRVDVEVTYSFASPRFLTKSISRGSRSKTTLLDNSRYRYATFMNVSRVVACHNFF